MFKNVASQKIAVFAFDTTTGAAKTGDAANITLYVSKDYGSVTALTDTSATEMDSTNAKGWYLFDVAQAETNADALLFTGKSSTSNIAIVGQLIFTVPPNFTALSLNSSGQADIIKVNGTSQTAGDLAAMITAVDDYVDTEVAAIKAKTDNLPSSFPTNFSSLSITAAGLVAVTSNVKKAAAITYFMFVLTDSTTHAPKPSAASIVVEVSKDGGSFATATNNASVAEIAHGAYVIALTSSETNCNSLFVRITATSCDDQLIPVFTQP